MKNTNRKNYSFYCSIPEFEKFRDYLTSNYLGVSEILERFIVDFNKVHIKDDKNDVLKL